MNNADGEFLRAFEDCSLSEFHHKDHIHVAWCYLQEHPFAEAMSRMRDGIRRFAHSKGKDSLYHETITVAFVVLIADRIARTPDSIDWTAFCGKNPDLFRWKPSILDEFYSDARLRSPQGASEFLQPDLAPLPAWE